MCTSFRQCSRATDSERGTSLHHGEPEGAAADVAVAKEAAALEPLGGAHESAPLVSGGEGAFNFFSRWGAWLTPR